jgi:hypothetical protein
VVLIEKEDVSHLGVNDRNLRNKNYLIWNTKVILKGSVMSAIFKLLGKMGRDEILSNAAFGF